MMAKAIKLAARGRFTTSPNPNVGCIITQIATTAEGDLTETIIGQGFHEKAGLAHAEIHALQDVVERGKSAQGATCYVTLEPCSHFGRTPPCALALIKAGVKRVVIAMQDPNPQVSGRGIGLLKEAGIEVAVGLLQCEAEALNPGFIQRMSQNRPRVTLKLASSLDAKTALANGESKWITSASARHDVQQFRAQSCAILTGSDTVLTDDPSLNVRWQELGSIQDHYPETELRQPVRIIIDSQNRITAKHRLFSLPGKIILARHTATGEFSNLSDGSVEKVLDGQVLNEQALNEQALNEQVSELTLPLNNKGKIDLQQLMLALAEQGLNEIWLETGSTLAGAFIEANLIDRLIMYVAPKIMGADAKPLIAINGLSNMQEVPEWQWQDVRKVGNDLRVILQPKL